MQDTNEKLTPYWWPNLVSKHLEWGIKSDYKQTNKNE